jgi:hypothetical protein
MSFFDSKEEVIEIQLTQFGKHLLSKGKFNPKLYAFFDDDILYDSFYSGVEENSIEAQNRIEEETPRLKTQYVFTSREKEILKYSHDHQPEAEKSYALSYALGNSEIGISKIPAWKVNMLKGEVENSNITMQQNQTLIIPQLNLKPIVNNIFMSSVPINSESDPYNSLENPDGPEPLGLPGRQYPDGSFFVIQEDYALIDIRELNSNFQNENFDIEVFLVEMVDDQGNIINHNSEQEQLNGAIEKLTHLSFMKKSKMIKDGFLLDASEISDDNNSDLDPSYVEYWLDIKTDEEIAEEIIISAENELNENIYLTAGNRRRDSNTDGSLIENRQTQDINYGINDDGKECN